MKTKNKFEVITIVKSVYTDVASTIKNALIDMDKKDYSLTNIINLGDSVCLLFKQNEYNDYDDLNIPG